MTSPSKTIPPGTLSGLPDNIAVLVLDDLRFDRLKLGRLCTGLPMMCEVVYAESLTALNVQLDKRAFDLIFVDYELPDGSGLDALEMIRLSPRNCNAVSIMVTGFDEASIAFGAMRRGCADYITKDELSPSSFERAVTNALQKSVLNAQVESQTVARKEVEADLKQFADQCISDIKPMVSRMQRQLRKLRDTPAKETATARENLECVEATCQSLAEFVSQLENQFAHRSKSDIPLPGAARALPPFAAATANQAAIKPKNAIKRVAFQKPKRPPSPFSRPLS